jgi:hypothetical protein
LRYLQDVAGRTDLTLFRPGSDADVAGLVDNFAAGEAWPHAVAYNGRNATNIVYFDGDTLHIIEAKGGDAAYGTRNSVSVLPDTRISQTHPQYPRDVAWNMRNSPLPDGRSDIGYLIEEAYSQGNVRYVGVRTGGRTAILEGNPVVRVDEVFLEPRTPGGSP